MNLKKYFISLFCFSIIVHSSIWSMMRTPRINLSPYLPKEMQTTPTTLTQEQFMPQATMNPELLQQMLEETIELTPKLTNNKFRTTYPNLFKATAPRLMSRLEALEILGLEQDAIEIEIQLTYQKLVKGILSNPTLDDATKQQQIKLVKQALKSLKNQSRDYKESANEQTSNAGGSTNFNKTGMGMLGVGAIGLAWAATSPDQPYATLDELIADFETLPYNRSGKYNGESGFAIKNPGNIAQQTKIFKDEIEKWIKMRSALLNKSALWLQSNQGEVKPSRDFFDTSKPLDEFKPFVQKIVAKPNEIFIMRGDLHGDIASIIQQLKDMKNKGLIDNHFKLRKDINLVFLGDYVDRGHYGSEVLYVLARLGNANPQNTLYVRGNHEDIGIQSRYGYKHEVANKFNDHDGSLHKWIGRMYDFMPTAIYLGEGNRYLMLCHGGIEQGYNPKQLLTSDKDFQLIGALNRQESVQNILKNTTISRKVKNDMSKISEYMQDNLVLATPTSSPLPLGHMWNDVNPTNSGSSVRVDTGRGLRYGQEGVDAVLDQQEDSEYKFIGVVRSHQHGDHDMMKRIIDGKGVANMRCNHCHDLGADSIHRDVLTMNISPDSDQGKAYGFNEGTALHVIPQSNRPWLVNKVQYRLPLDNAILPVKSYSSPNSADITTQRTARRRN